MTLANLLKGKIEKRNRTKVLVVAVLIELILGGLVWKHTKSQSVVLGLLVKNGNSYVIAWKDEYTGYDSHSYSTLKEALHFVQDDLRLSPGRNSLVDEEVEFVWLQERFGAYVLMWKTMNVSFLNRLTFQNEADANYFEDAFKRGSYTSSPFGHSVLFVPSQIN